jgi:Domain of unknown function (DUF4386)
VGGAFSIKVIVGSRPLQSETYSGRLTRAQTCWFRRGQEGEAIDASGTEQSRSRLTRLLQMNGPTVTSTGDTRTTANTTEGPDPSRAFSLRSAALLAGVGLLVMAVIAPFVVFGVLGTLVVSGDALETFNNMEASQGLFRSGIAGFLVVIVLDILVAWALYVLLAPVNRSLAILTAWLRVAFAAVFASALISLLDAAELVAGAAQSTLSPEQISEQVLSSVASFEDGWTGIALAIFGVHLLCLGYLLFRSVDFPGFLGVLVVIAGAGYLFDSFGTILVPDYALTIATFTFVGEALLIFWLFWRAIKGFPSESARTGAWVEAARPAQL